MLRVQVINDCDPQFRACLSDDVCTIGVTIPANLTVCAMPTEHSVALVASA
jgi:hypothetical protein